MTGLDCSHIWQDGSPGVFNDLITFWDGSIKNRIAAAAIEKIIRGGGGSYYVFPSIEVGDILLYFSPLISVTSVLCLCVLSVYHVGGQKRKVDPMPGYCWPTFYDAEPTLAQYWVAVSCLTPRWMWATLNVAPATLAQHSTDIGSVLACTAIPAAQQRLWTSVGFMLNWTSNGSTSCVCWEYWQATFVFCTSPGVKILKC